MVETTNGATVLPPEAEDLVPARATLRVQPVANNEATLQALAAAISSDMTALHDTTKTQSMTTWDTNSEQIYGQYGCKSGYCPGYQCGDILGTDLR